ncbi:MAG: hypothetical protein B6U68_04485 [Candidatus Aenigmarchaeota archaeon ex4484_14]|nr:MAG: hypothetical protein B6U68_04485 [Candidatus Aenigmarchaeota archaeon ex4484_14]
MTLYLLIHMIHPTDYRYLVKELDPYLSDEAFLGYKLAVEAAYIKALANVGVCPEDVAREISKKANINTVTPKKVKEKETELKHDIRAMVDVLADAVSERAKPFVHLGLTSYDVVNTAQALMLKDVTKDVIIPSMIELEKKLIILAEKYKDTVQIGRTHGQHAEPITFGFYLAGYVDRFGEAIEKIDYFSQLLIAFSTMADFANDMRHLQRTEIGEVSEQFSAGQVGSSTMPQKRNPISWENIVSQWKAVMPHIISVYMDIISEHQRDLTNSASARYYIPEIINAFVYSIKRTKKNLDALVINEKKMKKNLEMTGTALAEPVYIMLAMGGHTNAHKYVKNLVNEALKSGTPLSELIKKDEKIKKLLDSIPEDRKKILEKVENYTGTASDKTEEVVRFWRSKLGI